MKMLAVSVVAMLAMIAMVITVTMATATATKHPKKVTKPTKKTKKANDSDAFPPIARRDPKDDGTCINTDGPTPISQYAILTVLARRNTLLNNAEDVRTLLETNFVDAYNAVASCAQNGAFYTLTSMSIVRSSIGSTFIVTDPSTNGGRRLEDAEEAEEIDFLIFMEGECVGCPDIGGDSGPVFIDQIDPSILDQTQRRMMQMWQHQEGSSGKAATDTGATAKPRVKAHHQTQTYANTDVQVDVGNHQPHRGSGAKDTKQPGVERSAIYGLSDDLRDDNDVEDAIEPSAPSSRPRRKRGRLDPRRHLDGSKERIHNGVSFSLLHRRSLNTKSDDSKDKGRSGNRKKETKANSGDGNAGTGASGDGDGDGDTPDGQAPKSTQGAKSVKASRFSEPTSAPTGSTDPDGPAPGPDTTAAPFGKSSKMESPSSVPSESQKQSKAGSPMPKGTGTSTKMSKSENGSKECICFPPTISAVINEYDAVIQTAATIGIDAILSLVLVDPSTACTADDFETRTATVLVTIQIDPSLSSTAGGGLTDGQVEQFEDDLMNEYNAQNSGALNDQSCDPFFRRVINVELVQVVEGYSRRLQDSNTDPSFHGYRNMQTSTDFSASIGVSTYISIYTFFCFSCESGTLLYDDVDFVTVRRGRALNEEGDTYDDSADNSNIEGEYGYSSWTAEEFTPSQHHEDDPRFADILKAINAHKAKESTYANAGADAGAGTGTGVQPEDSPFGPPLNINNHRQLQSAIADHRSLQGGPDDTINPDIDCLCSANATQEGVTEQQILNALNETLQSNNIDPILSITNLQEVQEIDCSDTVDDEQVFDIRIAIELLVCEDDQQVSSLSLDDPRVPELEATFATTYNDLVAERYCDPFFRVINNVTFTSIITDGSTVVPEEISGSIAVSIEAIVTLRCRGCDPAVTTLYAEGPLLATMSGRRHSRKMQYTDHASNRGAHDGGAHDGGAHDSGAHDSGDYDGTSDIGHDMGDLINEQLTDHLRSSINANGDVDGDVDGGINGSDSDSHTLGDSDGDDSTNVLKRTAADARLHINDNRACTSNSVTHPYDATTTSISSAGRALGADSATRGGDSSGSRKPRRTNELTETCYCDIAPIAERSPSEAELMAVYNINVQDLGLACIVGVNECPPREPFTTEFYVQFTDTNFGNPTPGQTSLSFQEVEDLVNDVAQVFLNLYNSTDSDGQDNCDPGFRDLATVTTIVSVQINNEGETFTFNSNRFLMDAESKTMHLDNEGRDDLDFDRSQPYFDAAIHANGHGDGHRKLQTSVDFSQYDPNNPTLSILVTGLGTCIFCSSYFGFGNDITGSSFVTVRKQRHLFASGEDSFGRVGSADFHADTGMDIHARTAPSMVTEGVAATVTVGVTDNLADSGIRSSNIPDFMHEYDGVANLRRLQSDIDTEGVREDESQCYCGVGTNQIIIFNVDDFRDEIDEEVDLPPNITLDDVQLVQTQDCEAETNDFAPEDLQAMLLMVPDVSASDLESFSAIFEMVYNELAAQYCDMLFRRVVVGSAIATINIPGGQTPNSDGCVLGDITMETDGRCRGCGDGTPLVDEDPSATSPTTGGDGRRSLQQLQAELDLDREFNVDLAGRPRRRRMQTEDTCFCAVDAIPDRGPFLLELYAALNSKLTELGVESICGLADEILDILPPTEVPTSRPTSNPTVLASSAVPTVQPTNAPTAAPTPAPTDGPTTQPTRTPTNIPTSAPAPATPNPTSLSTGNLTSSMPSSMSTGNTTSNSPTS